MSLINLDRLGMPGVAGLGLLLFCGSFYFGNVAPAKQSLVVLQGEEAKLRQAKAEQSDQIKTTQTDVPLTPLPQLSDAPQLLKQLNSISEKHGVTIEHASYRLSEKDGQRKIEMNLPLQGKYPAIRTYVREILSIGSAISLDEVNLQRASSREPQVEASVRLSYYLSTP